MPTSTTPPTVTYELPIAMDSFLKGLARHMLQSREAGDALVVDTLPALSACSAIAQGDARATLDLFTDLVTGIEQLNELLRKNPGNPPFPAP